MSLFMQILNILQWIQIITDVTQDLDNIVTISEVLKLRFRYSQVSTKHGGTQIQFCLENCLS